MFKSVSSGLASAASAIVLLVAANASAATFTHVVDHVAPSPTVTVRSTMLTGDNGPYVTTVTVMLASGATSSQSNTKTHAVGGTKTTTFTFASPVIVVNGVIAMPDEPLVAKTEVNAGTWAFSSSVSGSTVTTSSQLLAGEERSYSLTVAVMLANGARAFQSQTVQGLLGSPVASTFTFGSPVASFLKEDFD